MKKTLLFKTATMLLMAAPAAAQDIPRYDPEAYCKNVANVSGGSAMIFSGCIDMEQSAYNKLKASWATLAPKTRKYCDQVARSAGGSYSLLDGCIDMETNAASSAPQFKF